MAIKWKPSLWHFETMPVVVPLPMFSKVGLNGMLGESTQFIDSFCQPEFDGTWSSITSELGVFTPCFIDIVILGSAHIAMLCLALARLRVLYQGPRWEKLATTSRRITAVASFLALFCAVVPLMQLSARVSFAHVDEKASLPPSEIVSLILAAISWAAAFVALLRELRSSTAKGNWYLRFAFIYVLVGQVAKLRSVIIAQDYYNDFFMWLFYLYVGAHVLLGLFAGLFFPVRVSMRHHRRRGHQNEAVEGVPEEHVTDEAPAPEAAAGTTDYLALPESPVGDQIFPELHTNIYSRITFSWVGPLLKLGHKRPLQDEDIYQLDPIDSAEVVSRRFNAVWTEEKKKPKPWLLGALHTCFGARFWYAGIWKVLDNLSQFVGPVMLSSLLSAMQSEEEAWHGYIYGTAIFLGIVFGFIFDALFFTNVQRVGFQIRQALVASVFTKSLQLSHIGRQGFSSGRIVNMMTNDTETLQMVVQQLHNLWSAPFRIVLCMILLYRQLGVAALISLAVLLILIPVQAYMLNKQRQLVKQALIKADVRIGLMNEILASMDVVKCYAWEDSFASKVLSVRTDELSRLRVAQYIGAVNFFIVNSVPVITTVVGFTVFGWFGGNLTPAKAFTSISLFSILRMPLYMLPQLINQVVNANVSLKRLQDMLMADERSSDSNPPIEPGKPVVEVHKSSFTWGGKEDKYTLEDISLSIQEGELVAIVGATGQGKSSLLGALIGEVPPVDGSLPATVRGQVAYVAQVSWIFNATIRDNILFGHPYEHQRYQRALRVSALDRDLEILEGGDLTEIGERGVNLSGGQKQRVSIARAVYADADIYLFDDPLSALDAHVAKEVFDQCVHGALQGKTRVMVTNQLHFLPQVDKVVVLEEGQIVEQGGYSELMGRDGPLKTLMEQAGSLEDTQQEAPPQANGEAAGEKKVEEKDSKKVEADEGEKKAKAGTQLVTMEDRETGVVGLDVIRRYADAMGGAWALFLILGLFFMVEVPRVGSSLWVGVWSGAEASGSAKHSVDYYITVYAVICFGQVIFVLLRQFWLAFSTLKAAQRLHEGMLASILRAPMSFFQANPVGRLINRFTKDTSDIDRNLTQQGTLFLQYFFQLISTFGLIGALNITALWAIIPLLLVFYFVYCYFQDSARELKRLEAVTRSPVYAQFGEALNGQATIRSYHAQLRMVAINGRAMDRNTRYAVANMAANRWLAVRLEFLGGLMVWATATFSVLEVQHTQDQAALASTMGIILSYSLSITMLLTNVLRTASQFENSFNAVERVGSYMDLEPEAAAVIEDRRPPPGWPSQGAVLFDRVVMRYRADLPPVLKELTVDVKGGQKVGVVGRTGAGKSSLFNALFRIVEIESGKITIDDCDIQQFGVQDVRRALMIIPQTPILFTGSIRFNLDPFEERDDAQVWEALERAHMKDVISRMPLGLHTEVLEGGDNFSVGQRQLLSLARALLRRSKILVLDEATAAVDVGTDALIQKTIREEFRDCTMLIIAHRLNTIIDCERILVMDNGKAVEFGTPAELVDNEQSLFSGMVRSTGAANAKYLTRIARGEVDMKEVLAEPAAKERQKWARQASSRKSWMVRDPKRLAAEMAGFYRDLGGGDEVGILREARTAAITIQSILNGERAQELEAALREADIDEARWWRAFLRFVRGLYVMGRHWQAYFGYEDDMRAGPMWAHRLESEGGDGAR